MAYDDNINLRFTCPKTKKPIDIQIPGTWTVVAQRWKKELRRKCPHCGIRHHFIFNDGYMRIAEEEFSHFAVEDVKTVFMPKRKKH